MNPRSRSPAGDDPCSKDPRNRFDGNGRESIEGANDSGFREDGAGGIREGGDGGKREGAGPEGDGGGSSDCKLLPWSLLRSVGGCGGGLDGEGVDGPAGGRDACIDRDPPCDAGECDDCDINSECWLRTRLRSRLSNAPVPPSWLPPDPLFDKPRVLFPKYLCIIRSSALLVPKLPSLRRGDPDAPSRGLSLLRLSLALIICSSKLLLGNPTSASIHDSGTALRRGTFSCDGIARRTVRGNGGEWFAPELFSTTPACPARVVLWEFAIPLLLLPATDFPCRPSRNDSGDISAAAASLP